METNCETHNVRRLTYSIAEAAVASGVSRATLYRLIGDGKLATVKLGRRQLIPRDKLRALLRVGEE